MPIGCYSQATMCHCGAGYRGEGAQSKLGISLSPSGLLFRNLVLVAIMGIHTNLQGCFNLQGCLKYRNLIQVPEQQPQAVLCSGLRSWTGTSPRLDTAELRCRLTALGPWPQEVAFVSFLTLGAGNLTCRAHDCARPATSWSSCVLAVQRLLCPRPSFYTHGWCICGTPRVAEPGHIQPAIAAFASNLRPNSSNPAGLLRWQSRPPRHG